MGLCQFKINIFSIITVARIWYAFVFKISVWNLTQAFLEKSVNVSFTIKPNLQPTD